MRWLSEQVKEATYMPQVHPEIHLFDTEVWRYKA
jgi:hypothetical protein